MANICGMIMEDQAKWPTVVKYCRYPEDLHETVNRCLIETETKMPGQHVDFILVSLDVDKDDPKYGKSWQGSDWLIL